VTLNNTDNGGRYYGYRTPCWLGDSLVCAYGYSDDHEDASGLAIADTADHWRPLGISGGGPDAHIGSECIVYSAFLPAGKEAAVFEVHRDGSADRQLTRR